LQSTLSQKHCCGFEHFWSDPDPDPDAGPYK
jgi:hypothetical protein